MLRYIARAILAKPCREGCSCDDVAVGRGSPTNVALGLCGSSVGSMLLAAFVIEVPPRRRIRSGCCSSTSERSRSSSASIDSQAPAAPALALPWCLPGRRRERLAPRDADPCDRSTEPFAGDSGSSISSWRWRCGVGDAIFGFVAFRLGAVWRLGALSNAVGSVAGHRGEWVRLELTVGLGNPTHLQSRSHSSASRSMELAWVRAGPGSRQRDLEDSGIDMTLRVAGNGRSPNETSAGRSTLQRR